MPAYRANDISCLPFTHEMKAGPYQEQDLKNSLIKLGAWEHSFDAESLVAEMDAAGVEKALVPAQSGAVWGVPYETVAELHEAYPHRLYGMAGIDPRDIAVGVRKLERAVREQGFVGAHSYPHWYRLSPDDRAYYPFYWKCCELDVPIQIQAGQAFQHGLRSVGHPGAFDQIAVDFPELKLLAIHTGYPWEREMVAVAWKHENVVIGADTHHPRDWAPELVRFIDGPGREQVVFGTNYPCLKFADAIDAVGELGLSEQSKRALLYDNMRRVYGI